MMGDGGCDDDGSAGSSLRPPRPEIMVDFEADHQAEQKQNHRNLQITQKSDEILRCLSGSKVSNDARDEGEGEEEEEEVVDLWHLRSLALSPGGLLDSTHRKRAWPKLLGVDARVLGKANGTSIDEQQQRQQQKIRLSSSTVAEIKRDVGRTAWDVEGHIKRLRRERQAAKEMERRRSTDMFQKNNTAVPRTRKANQNEKAFVPTLPPRPTDGAIVGTVSPAMSPALPSYYPSTSSSASRVRSSSSSNGSVGGNSVASLSATVTSSPARNATFDVSLSFHGSSSPVVAYSTFDGIDSPFPAVSNIVRNGKGTRVVAPVDVPQAPRMPIRTKQEQDILLNILTTVLRTPPTDSSSCTNTKSTNTASVNDERLHYTSGLHSLASLLLINLESPSLTSLTLQKLSSHHLRDVMRPTLDELGACIRIAFLPLLHRCDPVLHRHLVQGGANGGNGIGLDCPFAVGWIVSWFAHESTLGLEVASRLIDVFLCSHPLMPVYLSVAMLTHSINRNRIVAAAASDSIGAGGVVEVDALNQVLCRVPRDMVSLALGNSDEVFFGNDVSSNGAMVDEGRRVELMDVFEGIIDAAIGLMRNVPPTTLLRNAKSYCWGTLSAYVPTARSATSMQSLPAWAVAPTASTDWSLIQKAKAAREAQLSPMSDASTPTSSPLASKRFFLGSISSPKKNADMKHTTIVSSASSYQLAVDAAGLGGAATADVRSARLWKMVICIVGVTAAVSTGMVGLVPEEEVNNIATPHSSPVPGRRPAAWNEVEGKFESSTSKIISNPHIRRVPHSSPAPIRRCAVWNKAEASPPTVSRVVSSVKVHSENAFVYGMSFVGESVGPIFKPTMAEESTIDFDAKQSSTVSVDDKFKNLMSGRLDRLGNVIEDALPSSYYY